MFSPRLRHTDQWRFGVFWQDDGGEGGGAGTGADATGGGAGGGIGSDTAAAAQGPPGSGLGGLSAVGPTSFGQGGGGPAATSTTTGGAAPGGGPGAGISGGGGGGVGAGAAPAGAPTGGNAGGVAGGGFGAAPQGTNPAIANPLREAAQLGLGHTGVLSGLANAAPSGTVTSSPIGPPAIDQNTIAILNNELSNLTRGGGGGFGFGDQSGASPLGTPGTTLGQLALANQRRGMNMGYPAIEGVSPGLTAAPAGPSPSPGQNVNANPIAQAISQTPANPFGPSEVALAQDLAGTTPAATAFASPASPVSPAETETAQNTANLAAQVANQPAATQMNAAADNTAPATTAPTATPATTGGFGQLFQDIFGGGVSNPTTLPQLAAMLGIGA